MRLAIAGTGASGSIYLQRLLDAVGKGPHEIHLVLTNYAKQVIAEEIGELAIPPGTIIHSDKSMNAPFASGSALFDAMVIIPCSMGTLAKVASGTGDTLTLRAADVFLKEGRPLFLVPRETPWNLIHARNVVSVIEAGGRVVPACPSFYSRPETVAALVDTVVWRILDQLGIPATGSFRWNDE